MPLLPITALYGALTGFLLLYLAYGVVQHRQRHKAGLGHSQPDILISGRIHANAAEYIPITLILLSLAELNGAPNMLLHGIGVWFLISRMLHAWGFKKSKGGSHFARYWGVVITFMCIILLGLTNIVLSWRYLI